MIIKIVAIGLIGVLLSIIVKQIKPEFSFLINIAVGVIIFSIIVEKLFELLSGILSISTYSNLSSSIITTLFKVMGIGYLIEFSADIAEDSGNATLANKITFAGKVIICCISLPIFIDLFNIVVGLL